MKAKTSSLFIHPSAGCSIYAGDPHFDNEHDVMVLPSSQTHLDKPPLYIIIMHNDDYTLDTFVVNVLINYLDHSYEQAVLLTHLIHTTGYAKVGLYPKEIAETKISLITDLAEQYEYPLRLTLQLEEDY